MTEQSPTIADDYPGDEHRYTAVAYARQAIIWAGVPAQLAERYALLAVDNIAHAGLLLPTGTETVEQFAVRYLIDGEPAAPYPVPTNRQGAESMVRAHDRERAQTPGWRGEAVLLHRHQHTTPWTTVEEKP